MNRDVWVFCEQRDGVLQGISFELISEAIQLSRKLEEKCFVLLIGHQLSLIADSLTEWDIQKIFLVEHPFLSEYNSDLYANIVAEVIRKHNPRLFLFGATSMGRDFVPKVAARMGTGMVSNCSMVRVDDNVLTYVKPVYGGKLDCTIGFKTKKTHIVNINPGSMDIDKVPATGKVDIENIDVNIDLNDMRSRKIGFEKGDPRTMDVTEAEIVVGAGRGLGKAEHIQIVQELADSLGASLAGTRAAVDAGWLPRERQVGQTGKTISPKAYIACGLSGDMKHTIGMKDAEFIIAINTDRDASIFEIADVKVYKDLFEVVPAISRQLNTQQKNSKKR